MQLMADIEAASRASMRQMLIRHIFGELSFFPDLFPAPPDRSTGDYALHMLDFPWTGC